jgi:hypothetical protein
MLFPFSDPRWLGLFRVGPGEAYDIAEEEPPKDAFFRLNPTFLTLKSPF